MTFEKAQLTISYKETQTAKKEVENSSSQHLNILNSFPSVASKSSSSKPPNIIKKSVCVCSFLYIIKTTQYTVIHTHTIHIESNEVKVELDFLFHLRLTSYPISPFNSFLNIYINYGQISPHKHTSH